jgi:hypothetical protein
MAKIATRPKGIDEAIAKGARADGVPIISGGVLCPYSYNDPHYWAWQGAYEARQLFVRSGVDIPGELA